MMMPGWTNGMVWQGGIQRMNAVHANVTRPSGAINNGPGTHQTTASGRINMFEREWGELRECHEWLLLSIAYRIATIGGALPWDCRSGCNERRPLRSSG